MRLDGVHHVTCITADAKANLDFYTRVLGLRLVGKSVNQDDPYVYHLFYGDEHGRPGADLTFFEYEGARPGRAGGGMVHRIVWRVASADALEFWRRRLAAEGIEATREGDHLVFADAEGLAHELVAKPDRDEALIAVHPDVPQEVALRGFEGVRAYGLRPGRTAELLTAVMGATEAGENAWELRADHRGGMLWLDPVPAERGRPGAGTVHHVAWGTSVVEHPRWVEHLRSEGFDATPVIDRHFFRSIYFREPGGVLFEIADDGPGFSEGRPLEELGRRLVLPPKFEPHRAEIEAGLKPLPDPRAGWTATTGRTVT